MERVPTTEHHTRPPFSWFVTLEESVYEWADEDVVAYRNKMTQLGWNIQCNAQNLLNKDATLLCHLNDQALAEGTSAENEKRNFDLKVQRCRALMDDPDIFGREVENLPSGVTCRKCKTDKYLQLFSIQLRSADEPMTSFIECSKCGTQRKIAS